jgi:lipopolysaccharide assembly outer membrane protein LptD (OstA)
MRLRFLGLFFLISLPTNLHAQLASTPLSPPPNPVAPSTPAGKSPEFAPLLPFQSAQSTGPIPVEITSAETRFEGGVAIAEKDVVVRYADVTIYCDYAEYNPDTHDIVLRGNVRFYRDRYAFTADRAIYNLQTTQL